MTVRVSVVVPVYNPGPYLEPCVASVLRQSLGADGLEAIFVDDGSTDGSGARLDRVAADASNVRVIHIPNSGWPGTPRNVGIDAARGDHILFLDADDWLGDEAAERMSATAERTGADVVVGREVGHGRGVPRELFRRNVDDATLESDPLVRLMTPHKLFRRSMLVDHGIRFPEGRRRFEDHVFVLRAYFAARRISILADYACYHWVTRADHGNASDQYADPHAYYRAMRDVLDVIDANTGAGPARERLTAHWYRRRCLDRLRGQRWTGAPRAHDRDVFDAVRDLVLERIGPGVDDWLPLSHRLRSTAVRLDRPELITALARVEHGLRARVRLRSLEQSDGIARLALVADIFDAARRPIRFSRQPGGGLQWEPPESIGGRSFAPHQLEVARDLDRVSVSIALRDVDSTTEHDIEATVEGVIRDTPDGPQLSIRARAEIDPRTAAAGRELPAGDWEILAEVRSCGWHSLRRLGTIGTDRQPLGLRVAEDGSVELGVARPPHRGSGLPVRRRSGSHALERLVPRAVLQRTPVGVRRAAKRWLLRLGVARR